MSDVVYMTEEGYEQLKAEIEHLTKVERPKCSQAIATAREKGDLSENAEYDAAKEAQGMLEAKIAKLTDTFGKVRLIDKSQLDTSRVNVMSKVKIKNLKMKKEFTYMLVSEKEANVREMKISVKSPIGSALLGKEVGDKLEVATPGGKMDLEILDISL